MSKNSIRDAVEVLSLKYVYSSNPQYHLKPNKFMQHARGPKPLLFNRTVVEEKKDLGQIIAENRGNQSGK